MKLFIALAICALSPSAALAQAPQTPPPAQAPTLDAEEKKLVDAQLAAPKLDSRATVASVQLKATPLRQIIEAIGTAAGITVRYDSAIATLDSPADASLVNVTADDALRRTLEPQKLAFKVTGAKSVFVFADTPANREKYTESIRAFSIANANMAQLTQTLNVALSGKPEGLRPGIVTFKESRKLVVRATPDKMAEIAKLIAANDRQ